MAKEEKDQPVGGPPVFSEVEKSKARAWFKKAATLRDQRNYDYALECLITGLGFWPDAVEEGHMPLLSLALQRQQAGGKKPGMMDGMKMSMSGKDAKAAMLNAETLLSKDPSNPGYLDGVLKNAAKLDLVETVKWISPRVLDSLRNEKKPNPARFKGYRETLIEFCDRCDARDDAATMADLLALAVESVEMQLGANPGDMALKDEQRDLAGKLTITKGKYSNSSTFRDSVLDVDKQTLMQEQEQRGKQAESKLDALVVNARKELAANPTVAGKLNGLVDLLLKTERKADEDEAVSVLQQAFEKSSNYSFKLRADDIRLRQVARVTRQLKAKAHERGRMTISRTRGWRKWMRSRPKWTFSASA